jgi:hypothetical protein
MCGFKIEIIHYSTAIIIENLFGEIDHDKVNRVRFLAFILDLTTMELSLGKFVFIFDICIFHHVSIYRLFWKEEK